MLDFIRKRLAPESGELLNLSLLPEGEGMGDGCFALEESGVHFFYISRDRRLSPDCSLPGQEIAIGHLAGSSLPALERTEDALSVREGACDSCHVWAPSVVYAEGEWRMFYCAVSHGVQTIAVAHSGDLYHWARREHGAVIDCRSLTWAMVNPDGSTDCRDPYVVNFGGAWYCYVTLRHLNGNAAVGVFRSRDLKTWKDLGPCLEQPWRGGEETGTELCESPCVFQKDGLYYLVYNQGAGLRYAVSETPTDFRRSPIRRPYSGETPWCVYNFELLDAGTGLFGYLCGGYFSSLRFGYCAIGDGELLVTEINPIEKE